MGGLGLADNVIEELWFGDDDPNRSTEEASRSLAASVAQLQGLKPFPAVAQRMMNLVSDPDVRIDDVSRLVQNDPAIAGKTVRLANSALYRVGQPVDTIDQAIMRLGLTTLNQMVTALAVVGMFRDSTGLGRDIRDHCVGTAAIGRALARRKNWYGHGQVFMTGLMHDLGQLLSMQTGELVYDDIPAERHGPDKTHVYEREVLGYDHAVLGAHVLRGWRIPDPVPQAVAWHHQPARGYEAGGDIGLLVAYTRVADRVDHLIRQETAVGPDLFATLANDAAASYAGISANDFDLHWDTMVEARIDALAMFI